MLYPSIGSLPASVRADLPIEAQEAYLAAYNTAWAKYAEFADREAFCHRLARSEVRRAYRRQPDGRQYPRVRERVLEETSG